MDILNKKQKIIVIIITALMIIFVGYYIISKINDSKYIELETEETEIIENEIENDEITIQEQNIILHITGAVKRQGIVEVKKDSRISDIIEAAGGITKDADLSKINLAYIVKDGQKIYVPSINDKEDIEKITEEAGENVIDEENSVSKNQKVNINTASQTELETLSGIGPSTALKIINYRNENGDFKKIEDIKNVPGIGESKFESLKESICVK
ncbi:MAG: helix-hairpin-helix domain-containing protein [Clostridia bacterium]|nr:helix-hairpin-helix domain-containing protein [Clostridia bacterium]